MESAQISSHPDRKDAAVVNFTERYKAEQFITNARNIPHVGKVELAWMNNASQTQSFTPSFDNSQADVVDGSSDHAVDQFGSANPGGGKDVRMEEVSRGEMDYDVADDDDRWLAD